MTSYGMDVIEIPTNRPGHPCGYGRCRIHDEKREIPRSRKRKVKEAACREPSRVLVGTITIETSELISKMLRREGIPASGLKVRSSMSYEAES